MKCLSKPCLDRTAVAEIGGLRGRASPRPAPQGRRTPPAEVLLSAPGRGPPPAGSPGSDPAVGLGSRRVRAIPPARLPPTNPKLFNGRKRLDARSFSAYRHVPPLFFARTVFFTRLHWLYKLHRQFVRSTVTRSSHTAWCRTYIFSRLPWRISVQGAGVGRAASRARVSTARRWPKACSCCCARARSVSAWPRGPFFLVTIEPSTGTVIPSP